MFSCGRYRESPARRSPPRRALVPPADGTAGGQPLCPAPPESSAPGPSVAPFIENGRTSQKLRSRADEKRGRRGSGARSIPSSTCSSDSGAAGDGVECVCERKLEARRDPPLADRVCSSTTEVQHRAAGDHAHHRPTHNGRQPSLRCAGSPTLRFRPAAGETRGSHVGTGSSCCPLSLPTPPRRG